MNKVRSVELFARDAHTHSYTLSSFVVQSSNIPIIYYNLKHEQLRSNITRVEDISPDVCDTETDFHVTIFLLAIFISSFSLYVSLRFFALHVACSNDFSFVSYMENAFVYFAQSSFQFHFSHLTPYIMYVCVWNSSMRPLCFGMLAGK